MTRSSNTHGRLVLARKPGEGIRVGPAIVRLEKIQGKTASISIDAPRYVHIVRLELPAQDAVDRIEKYVEIARAYGQNASDGRHALDATRIAADLTRILRHLALADPPPDPATLAASAAAIAENGTKAGEEIAAAIVETSAID